jgi:hypothetical protein
MPRDVRKPLLFEAAWEVANKGEYMGKGSGGVGDDVCIGY